MRTPPALLAALTTLVLAGSACSGSDGSRDTAVDPGSDPSPSQSAVAAAPAAPVPDGPVRTRELATVMDTGTDEPPELCLGPIAESYPPQCGGPALLGWDWDWDTLGQAMFEQQGDVRWGTYVVTGEWDGTAMTPTEATPGALYDPMVPAATPTPAPATQHTDAELEQIATDLQDRLPGVLGAYGGEGTDGHVLADVHYDDGTLQEWADRTYGAGVVVISSALVDAG